MPRKHYAVPETTPAGHVDPTALADEISAVYDVLLEEMNRLRREAGLPERTPEDMLMVRTQVIARLQAAQLTQGER